jgi:transposase InsO family protein
VRALIATIAREIPSWGAERIRGELLKLGIVMSRRSVQRHRQGGPARPPSQSWRTFLTNHRPRLWAADLLTVQTLGFRTLYVLLFVAHGRRELVHLNVTAHPTAVWVWRQLIEATPWGRAPRYLVRDRDAVYGRDFVPRARRLGIETLLTPIRAPRANAIAERLVGTLRRECLDHVIILNEAHLRDPRRVRALLQRRPPSPDAGTGDADAGLSGDRRSDRVAARARWAAPRVRTGGLTLRRTFQPCQVLVPPRRRPQGADQLAARALARCRPRCGRSRNTKGLHQRRALEATPPAGPAPAFGEANAAPQEPR